jgi:hypothetical protein
LSLKPAIQQQRWDIVAAGPRCRAAPPTLGWHQNRAPRATMITSSFRGLT